MPALGCSILWWRDAETEEEWEAGISRREIDAKMDEEQDFRASSNCTTYDVLHITSSC